MPGPRGGGGGGGARTTIKCNWAKSSRWEGGKEVEDGMIAVSTRCNTVLDASENKGLPGVEPLLSPRAMDFFGSACWYCCRIHPGLAAGPENIESRFLQFPIGLGHTGLVCARLHQSNGYLRFWLPSWSRCDSR